MPLKNKKAAIFDIDGTVVDTLDVWTDVDLRLLESLGRTAPDRKFMHEFRERSLAKHCHDANPFTAYCGDIAEHFGFSYSAKEMHAMRFAISRSSLKEVALIDGVWEVLGHLKTNGIRICAATTTKRANIEIYCNDNQVIAQKADLGSFFEFFVTKEDVQVIKPEPECYLLALQKLGLGAGECFAVEDSIVGVTAAKRAGLDVVAVLEAHNRESWDEIRREADLSFESHYDFVRYLRSL